MKHLLLHNWNVVRIIRLILAILLVVQAIRMNEWITGIFALALLLMAIFNTGCGAGGSCYVPTAKTKNTSPKQEAIEYEEVV